MEFGFKCTTATRHITGSGHGTRRRVGQNWTTVDITVEDWIGLREAQHEGGGFDLKVNMSAVETADNRVSSREGVLV